MEHILFNKGMRSHIDLVLIQLYKMMDMKDGRFRLCSRSQAWSALEPTGVRVKILLVGVKGGLGIGVGTKFKITGVQADSSQNRAGIGILC